MIAIPFHFGSVALGAWGLRRFRNNPPFGNLISLLAFMAIAIIAIPVSTTAPIEVLRAVSGKTGVWQDSQQSVLCVALGMLIATPALTLTVANGRAWLRAGTWRRYAETTCLAISLAAVGLIYFEGPPRTTASPALLYAPLPLLLWAAVRFELAGVSWALLFIAFQSTWGAIQGRGPFSNQTPTESVHQLQLFLLATSLPLMFLATVIQDRRRAFATLSESEQEVRRQHAELETIYHSAPIGLGFVDTQMRYVAVNDFLAEMNGLSAAAHLGRTVRELFPGTADSIEALYRRLLETGMPIEDVEVRGTTVSRPGIERNWLVSRYPVENQKGSMLGVITVAQEITERRRAEEARHELAHASRLALVGELTASIAHEINQPLGAILSNADAAEMILDSNPTSLDEVRQILDDIRKDDLRASEVIRRLRSLLRKRELEVQSLDLNEVTSEVLWLVRAESGRRGIAVETVLAPNLPRVRGDKVHLQQVLLNLVLNGMESMADSPGPKKLTVRTVAKIEGCVELAVTDAGTGIAPSRLSRVFDPFFSTKKAGMGLGLSIARSLIEANGGRISVENNSSGGATFRFTVPTGAWNRNKEPHETHSRTSSELVQ